jgi:molybdate transport system substrate-binding protein
MASGSDIQVMATAAFRAAYLELLPIFERMSGHRVKTVWASTQDILARIKAGEPTDVVIMAASAVDELIKAGKLARGSRVNIATSWVAMAVRAGTPKPDIHGTDSFRHAMLAAQSIACSFGPSGVYLLSLFERLGIADQVNGKVRQIKGEPVGAVVARGEAEIGFQQMSELLPVAGIDIAGPLPPDIQQITAFATGVHHNTRVAAAANAMTKFFRAPAAHPIIRARGMDPA